MERDNFFPGKVYTVTSPNGCTVYDNDGLTLATVEANKQASFVATTSTLSWTDEEAKITATFNAAPAKLMALGLLGGGATNALPAGYIQCDFLESNADSLIWFAAPTPAKSAEIELDLQYTKTKASMQATCGVAGHTANWAYVDANQTMYSLYTHITGTNALERSVLLFKWQATPDNPNFPGQTSLSTQGITSTANARNTKEATGVAMLNYDNGAFGPYYSFARVWSVRVKVGDWEVKGMPCLNAQGVPVMYDSKSKTDYAQTKGNNFIAGFTLAQARNLSKLPATGGTLTISLPTGYEADAGVVSALETARSNGWTLTIQTYTPENATESASTFALRRIWVRRTQAENGAYVAADGSRWMVDWCVDMLTPDGSTPDEHGYELFRSQDSAVTYWELEPWNDPNAEELLTNQES